MSKRTLSIGGATYDLFVELPEGAVKNHPDYFSLPLGAKIRVENMKEACGGGAGNTAVGLRRLGCDACFEGILSSDQWGEVLMKNFIAEGVDVHCVTIVESEVSSFSIILSDASGERVILYEPGTNTHLHDTTFDKEMLRNVDWVYLNHMQEGSCVIQDDIVEMLIAEGSPKLTWNPGGCQIDRGMEPQNNRELLEHTDVLLLNKQEALAFTRASTVEDAIESLLTAGVAGIVITDGKHGCTASDGENVYHCPVVSGVTIVDTTGAGDAFGTGVTWALLEGMPLSEALKAGSINGASVVSALGAQTALLTDTEIRKRLELCDLTVSIRPL